MRIGIDMIGLQSPHSGPRGIGRYIRHFVPALVAADCGNHYTLYFHHGLRQVELPLPRNVPVRQLRPRPGASLGDCADEFVQTNADGLDVLLITSPFEETLLGYRPPARPLNGPKLAAILYDVIRFQFPAEYMDRPQWAPRYYQCLQALQHYDALLAISEATRRDGAAWLRAGTRVITIGCATDPDFFVPPPPGPPTASEQKVLQRLGINRPFVLNVGHWDSRKNLRGVIESFALLPKALRQRHQLVVACDLENTVGQVRAHARGFDIDGQLVLTGAVSDQLLRLLFQRCAVFVFPSLYEGFGLPILEAMSSGAPVVAGNNSSQVEVVGDAGLLAEAADPTDVCRKVRQVLEAPDGARALRERSLVQAGRFRWEYTANRARAAWEVLASRPGANPVVKPRLAFFADLPPRGTAAAEILARALSADYRVDVYHDAGYVPHLAFAAPEFGCYDYRLFDRRAAVGNYHGVVYAAARPKPKPFMAQTLARHPGVLVSSQPGNRLAARPSADALRETAFCRDMLNRFSESLCENGDRTPKLQESCPHFRTDSEACRP
jgi:glycosyltransferase involved in cell wall biosynthesis